MHSLENTLKILITHPLSTLLLRTRYKTNWVVAFNGKRSMLGLATAASRGGSLAECVISSGASFV